MRRVSIERLLLAVAAAAVLGALALRIIPLQTASNPGSRGKLESGLDTLVILIVSSACPACRQEPLATRVRRAHKSVAARSDDQVRFIGVAAEWDVTAGLALLDEFGPFDELSVGSSWANSLVLQHVWADSAAVGAVPQLVVVERVMRVTEGAEPFLQVTSQQTIHRALGMQSIAEWLEERAGGNREPE